MAYKTSQYMRISRTESGGTPTAVTFGETASSTYKKGAVLLLTSGYLAEASTDPTSIVGIAGIAGQNTTVGTLAPVYLAIPNNIFKGVVSTTIEATDMGTKYGIAKDGTTGIWYIDKSDTSNTRVSIVGFIDDIGTTNGWVEFIFHVADTLYA